MKTDIPDVMERSKFSRRRFLNTIGATGAGLFLAPYVKSGNIFAYEHKKNAFLTKVAVAQADKYDRTFVKERVQHLFTSIDGIGDIVSAGKKVGIKVNLTGGSSDTDHMVTHPEVVRAVAELIIDSGVSASDIYLVEALWGTLPASYTTMVQDLGITVVDLNKTAPYSSFITREVGSNSFHYSSFTMNKILADIDVYVSIPKLKHHYEAGYTGALKNQIGIVPKDSYTTANKSRRDALHTKDGTVSSQTHLPKSICDLNLARPVHLSVIDGVMNAHGGEGTWNPTYVEAADNIMFAGKDPVATDSIAAHFLGNNPEAAQFKLPSKPNENRGYCDNHLYMLHQKGIGTNILSEIEIVGDGAGLITSVPRNTQATAPNTIQLCQNYPNPFNPSTIIRFYVPASEYVALKIYNITGQEIETLVDGNVPAGTHELQWVPKNLSSGMYLCRMQAGTYAETKKLLYQK